MNQLTTICVKKRDRRTREAHVAERLEKQLVEYVGGNPSITQKPLISQIVSLKLCIETTNFREDDDWLGYHAAMNNCLAQLGLQASKKLELAA